MGVKITVTGDYTKTTKFLRKAPKVVSTKYGGDLYNKIEENTIYAVNLLRDNTPINTGRASDSWGYEMSRDKDKIVVIIYNTDVEGGYNVALLIEYDHATRGGGWVVGKHYIEPCVKAGYYDLLKTTWKELTSL